MCVSQRNAAVSLLSTFDCLQKDNAGFWKASSEYKQGWYHDQLMNLQYYRVKLELETNRHLPRDLSISHSYGQPQVSIKTLMLRVNFEIN